MAQREKVMLVKQCSASAGTAASGSASENFHRPDDVAVHRNYMGLMPLVIIVKEAHNLPVKDVSSLTNAFVVVECAGVRSQTAVQHSTTDPCWNQTLTLRCVFGRGMREELVVSVWHEDVFEDVLIGQSTLNIFDVIHESVIADEWLELLDERGLKGVGADVHIEVRNGKAPPLMELCADPEVTFEELERSITQEPAQCDEKEVDEATGRSCLHLLLSNEAMDEQMLNLLLKCNPKQARQPDRHGTPPLSMLCRRYGVTAPMLTTLLKCYPAAARTANRFGKLPLHFLARNPSLTKELLAILLGAFSGAAEAKDIAGNLPLHYLARNRALSMNLLQAFLDACGTERARAYAETPNKLGQVPLHELVLSGAFSDQHLRVMLRVSEQSTQVRDRYGQPPLHYLGWGTPVTPFMEQVAEEAALSIEMGAAAEATTEGRFVEDALALKLLLNVQKYSVWFHDYSQEEMRKLQHGNTQGQHRLLVTKFRKGDYMMRIGEPGTFLAILLQGELGVRTSKGGGFGARRLHKGALFGERSLFSSQRRAADVIALSSGYMGTILYSELELLAAAHPELVRKFNLALARGALEERLAETGESIDDLDPERLQGEIHDLLSLQAAARWKSRHAELQDAREGLYADLYAEKDGAALLGSGPSALKKILAGETKTWTKRAVGAAAKGIKIALKAGK